MKSRGCTVYFQVLTGRFPVQVQRERAAAEGAAGGSHHSHQTERLPEEKPQDSAAAARQVTHSHTHDSTPAVVVLFAWTQLKGNCLTRRSAEASLNSVAVSLRMASVLEEREEETRSLRSELQQKNSDIAGRSDFSVSRLVKVLKLLVICLYSAAEIA